MNNFNQDPLSKLDFLKLKINSLIEDENLSLASLLKGLKNTGFSGSEIIWELSKKNASDFIKSILNRIDWEKIDNSEYGQDTFFNDEQYGLYSQLKEDLNTNYKQDNDFKRIDINQNNWENHYWNDSISKLLQLLYQRLDPQGIQDYEDSGLLIEYTTEEKENTIDVEHLRGGIKPKGANAELRITDIKNADAGNSFIKDNDMYWTGMFFEPDSTITCTSSTNEIIINMDYVFLQEEGYKIMTEAFDGKSITGEQLANALNSYSKKSNSPSEIPDWSDEEIICSLSGGYEIFKVAEKTWVIPWYNIDGETYRKVRNGDKKNNVLSDKTNLDFTCNNENQNKEPHWIRLIMPRNKRRVEIEDLNRNFWVIAQVLVGISAYLFDEDGPLNQMLRGLLEEIAQIWENTLYLWAQAILTSQTPFYDQVHTEVVLLSYTDLYPNLKYDNFDNIDTPSDNFIENYLSYYKNCYSDYNLILLPYIRQDNYENNYYSKIYFPGIWIFDRNINSWIIKKSKNNIIDLSTYSDYLYAIKEEEENYKYIYPLSKVTNISSKMAERYYGLVRDNIALTGELTQIKQTNNTYEISGTLKIEFIDVGKDLIEQESEIIYQTNEITFSTLSSDTIDLSSQIDNTTKEEKSGTIQILKGYYQGELLSTYLDSRRREFRLVILPDAQLEPTFRSDTDLESYYPAMNDSQHLFDTFREQDEKILQAIIKRTFEYNLFGKDSFWTEDRLKYFYQKYFYDGENNGTSLTIKTTCENAPYSWYSIKHNENKKYYEEKQPNDPQGAWINNNDSYYYSTNRKINEDSILFVEGCRDFNWDSKQAGAEKAPERTCDRYFPYFENESDIGFLSPILEPVRAPGTVITGAAIGFKPTEDIYSLGFYDDYAIIPNPAVSNFYYPFIPGEYDSTVYVTLERYTDRTFTDKARYGFLTPDILDCQIDLITHSTGASTTVEEQQLVMRKASDDELTEDNWRVVLIRQNTPTPHLWKDNAPTKWEEYYQKIENVGDDVFYDGIIRKIAQDYIDDQINSGSGVPTVRKVGDYLESVFSNRDEDKDPVAKYFNDKQKEKLWEDYAGDQGIGYWKYYQAILHGDYPPDFAEQSSLYANVSGWDAKIKQIWTSLNGRIDIPIRNLQNLKTTDGVSYSYKDSEGNEITERLYVSGKYGNTIGIYVFGPKKPNGTYYYGRRAIRRKNDDRSFYIDSSSATGDVDALREGFIVISNSHEDINREAYKSMTNKKTNNPFYSPNIRGQFPDDNISYNIEWEEDLMDWDKINNENAQG